MTNVYTAAAHNPGFHIGIRPVHGLNLLAWAIRAYRISRQRRQLVERTDDQLADMGITRAEAEAEAARSIWDLPLEQFKAR